MSAFRNIRHAERVRDQLEDQLRVGTATNTLDEAERRELSTALESAQRLVSSLRADAVRQDMRVLIGGPKEPNPRPEEQEPEPRRQQPAPARKRKDRNARDIEAIMRLLRIQASKMTSERSIRLVSRLNATFEGMSDGMSPVVSLLGAIVTAYGHELKALHARIDALEHSEDEQ